MKTLAALAFALFAAAACATNEPTPTDGLELRHAGDTIEGSVVENGVAIDFRITEKDHQVAIEIVAYGPGIGMLKQESPVGNRIAEALDASPLDLRRRWVYREGDTTATGQVLRESVGGIDVLEGAAEVAAFDDLHERLADDRRDREVHVGDPRGGDALAAAPPPASWLAPPPRLRARVGIISPHEPPPPPPRPPPTPPTPPPPARCPAPPPSPPPPACSTTCSTSSRRGARNPPASCASAAASASGAIWWRRRSRNWRQATPPCRSASKSSTGWSTSWPKASISTCAWATRSHRS